MEQDQNTKKEGSYHPAVPFVVTLVLMLLITSGSYKLASVIKPKDSARKQAATETDSNVDQVQNDQNQVSGEPENEAGKEAQNETPSVERDWIYLYECPWSFGTGAVGPGPYGGMEKYEEIKDNFGNIYETGLGAIKNNMPNEENAYVGGSDWTVYDTNGEYDTFSGTVVLNYDYKDYEADKYSVMIVNDGNTGDRLYISPIITKGVEPTSFSIDISSVNSLSVIIQGGPNLIRIAEPILHKK